MPLAFGGAAATQADGPVGNAPAADPPPTIEMGGCASAPGDEASAATIERALFGRMFSKSPGARKSKGYCTLEAPHHAGLVDDTGAPIVRGTHVAIARVLEPEEPGGEARYEVKFQRVEGGRPAGWQTLVVPEGWMRKGGTLATSQNVDYTPIGPLLTKSAATGGLQIPLFQRRYCWTESQWGSLWTTVVTLAEQGEGAQHSLKRLLCLERDGVGSLVLDGQQRMTTCCILLASLRDAATQAGLADLAAQIASLLGLDVPRPDWVHVLSPTLDDRADFASALAPQLPPPTVAPDGAGPLVRCRAFFSAAIYRSDAGRGETDLRALTAAVTQGLHVLHFPISGAVQMQAVFEAAAKKSAAQASHGLWRARAYVEDEMDENGEEGYDELSDEEVLTRFKAHGAASGKTQMRGVQEEGVGMTSCDLIRNFVHEHFEGEEEQRRIYEQHWMPMERGCIASAGGALGTSDADSVSAACERGFAPALQSLGAAEGGEPPVGLKIYESFQGWFVGGAAEERLAEFAAAVAQVPSL